MKLRDRIKELRRVKAGDLLPNPKNWRTHPEAQKNALRGVLAEIGIADVILVRETPHGLQIIDGHCRAEIAADCIVPVVILDVTEKEADKLLVTLDPLAAMAECDQDKLEALLMTVKTKSDDVQALLDSLAKESGLVPELPTAPSSTETTTVSTTTGSETTAEKPVPESKYAEQYAVIVVCSDEANQQEVYETLGGMGLNCKVVST